VSRDPGHHRPSASTQRRLGAVLVALIAVVALAGCEALEGTTPKPTRAGFPGVLGEIARRDIQLGSLTSGDPGCTDRNLAPTAVSVRASGLDQAEPVTLYLYSFRNADSYQRLRTAIDACARSYVTDPETFESVDAAPFVMVGQGPWGSRFEAAIREALDAASPDP
jgi:hypothetical protein